MKKHYFFQYSEKTKPTYSFNEIMNLIESEDENTLNVICQVLKDEIKLYKPIEQDELKEAVEARYDELL